MPTIRIGSIVEGLVLSNDVKDLNGRLLLRKGVSLLERHLQLLKSWGVTEIEVVALPVEESSNAPATEADKANLSSKSEVEAGLKKIFARNDLNHGMIRELLELCIARKAKLPW